MGGAGRTGRGIRGFDAGFTMVELVAALTVMAIGIVGVIGVMNGSFQVAGSASTRFRATAIASEVLESLHGVSYPAIDVPDAGVYSSTTRTIGGETFEIERAIRWIKQDGTAATKATGDYKEARVMVSWTDHSGRHEVHQTTILYPGGLGPKKAAATVVPPGPGNPAPPTNLIATVPSTLDSTTGVDLAWTPPPLDSPAPVAYVVQYSRDASFAPGTYSEVTTSQPSDTPVLRITDLSANTTYHFRVASVAENGNLSTSWATAFNVQTSGSTTLVCSVGLTTVTPSAVEKRNSSESSALEMNPVVTLNALGVCTTTTFRMEYSPRAGITDTVLLTRTGDVFTGTIDGTGQAWTVGKHEVNVYDNLNTKRATMILLVCAHTDRVCA